MAAVIHAAACASSVAGNGWCPCAGSSNHGDVRGKAGGAAALLPRGIGWRLLIWLLLVLVAGRAAATHTEPTLSWKAPRVGGVYWLDPTGTASVSDAKAAFDRGAGRAVDPEQVMPIGPQSAVWYRLQLPPVQRPTRAVFRILFPGTDYVDLFRPEGPGGWYVMRAGDHVPVKDWQVHNIDPSFMFTIEPGEAPTYLRVANAQPIRVEWSLQDAAGFMESVKGWHLVLGAYVGFIAMVVLLSLFNAFSWRDPIHLYYAVHVVLVGLSILALAGVGTEYLWPDSPWWADRAPVVLPGLALAWFGLFARELVAERGTRIVSWLLLAHVAIGAAMIAAFLAVGRAHVYRAPSVYAAPGLLFLIAVTAWYSRRRPRVGLWVLGGLVLLAIGGTLPLLRNLGLIGSSLLVESGPQIGAALEIPLVLIGLYFRSSERRDNRLRLEQMATTDPLTGLANHRVLARRLEHLLRQARHDEELGAVLRVHVSNLTDIGNEFGREAGEAALMRAAECVAQEAREGDLVARDPGNDIVLVMGGRLTRAAAAEAGRNIIARGLKYSPRLPLNVALKLRIAAVSAPLPASDAAGLLQALTRLLSAMERSEKGRWLRFLDSPDASGWHGSWPSRPRDSVSPPPTREELDSVSFQRRRKESTDAPEGGR